MIFMQNEVFPLVAKAMEFDPLLREEGTYSTWIAPNGPQCVLGEGFGSDGVGDLVLKLYRVKLLKDVMMRPLLDETGAGALNNVLHSLQGGVCTEVRCCEQTCRHKSVTSWLCTDFRQ